MNRKILLLNAIAIIAVVFNHSGAWGEITLYWWIDQYVNSHQAIYGLVANLSYWMLVAFKQLTLFSVPAFLFTAGLFFSYAAENKQLRQILKILRSRLINLLAPYFFWSVIYFVWRAFSEGVMSPQKYLYEFLTGKASPIMFFVIVLVQLLIISPWLVDYCRRHPRAVLWISGLVLILIVTKHYFDALAVTDTGLLHFHWPRWLVFGWLFYYSAGIIYGQRNLAIATHLKRYRYYFLAALILAAVGSMLEIQWFRIWPNGVVMAGTHFSTSAVIYATAFLLTFLSFIDTIHFPFQGFIAALSSKTYGIYLSHWLVLELFAKGITRFFPDLLSNQFLFQPFFIAAGIGIPYLIMRAIAQSPMKRFYRYMFG